MTSLHFGIAFIVLAILSVIMPFFDKLCKGAEKDKRIAELEEENKQIKNSDSLCKVIGKLRKENAELKEANKILAIMKNDMRVELEKKKAECQGITNKLYLLTRAIDLLRKFLDAKSIEETCVAESEVEKFLKEALE